MGHRLFLNLICDIGENKRQGQLTLQFLKIDMRHWGPPIRAPPNFVFQRHLFAEVQKGEAGIHYILSIELFMYFWKGGDLYFPREMIEKRHKSHPLSSSFYLISWRPSHLHPDKWGEGALVYSSSPLAYTV